MKQNFVLRGTEVIAVGEASLSRALSCVRGCSACSTSASHSFDALLSDVLGTNGPTEYLLCSTAKCPKCASPIFEKSLVDFYGKAKAALDEGRLFDACDEEQDVVFVDEPTLNEAQGFISGCEYCSDTAEIPFDQLLDAVTGSDPTTTEYVICHPARCGRCYHEVMEKTLVVS